MLIPTLQFHHRSQDPQIINYQSLILNNTKKGGEPNKAIQT